jgi:hypothetical protein
VAASEPETVQLPASAVRPEAERLVIRSSERVAVVGKTGSGKTFWCLSLLAPCNRLIVCDAKGKIDRDRWGLTDWESGKSELMKGKPARLRVPPALSADEWDNYFWEFYRCPRTTVYIDELSSAGRATEGTGFRALLTRGREFDIGVVMSMQRPASIPLEALSEAEWFTMFQIRIEDDVKRMSKLIGASAFRPLPKYHYLLYNDGMDRPLFCKPLPFE